MFRWAGTDLVRVRSGWDPADVWDSAHRGALPNPGPALARSLARGLGPAVLFLIFSFRLQKHMHQMFGDRDQVLDNRLEMIFVFVQSMAANVFWPIAASENNPRSRKQPPPFMSDGQLFQTVSSLFSANQLTLPSVTRDHTIMCFLCLPESRPAPPPTEQPTTKQST